MDQRSQSNGWQTFVEHWWFLLVVAIAFLASQVLMFFEKLSGAPWIWFFVSSLVLMISGTGLIAYAKIPLYRSGRFFTFGIAAIPAPLKKHYRRGWRIFLFGVVLSLCLLWSK